MRKFALALAAVAVVASLAACSQSEAQKEYIALREKCANNSDQSEKCIKFRELQNAGQ